MRYLVLVSFLATTYGQSIDKTVFKNCSRTPYCSRLRDNVIEESSLYSADIAQYDINNNVATIPLRNVGGNNLHLIISLLDGNKIRAQVQEFASKRFELGNIVINEELKVLPLLANLGSNNLTLFTTDSTNPYWVRVLPGPPFIVEFYYNDDQRAVVLDGARLLMENSADSQAFTFKVDFPGDRRMYGLFDHAYDLFLGNTNNGSENTMDPFRLRNSDSWGYEANSPMALYGARPVIYAHSQNYTSGIFLHNAAEQWVDTTAINSNDPYAYFMVNRGAFDLFVLLGPTIKEVVREFTNLTGRAHLPQIWALGYHQCRFSYRSQDDVKEVANRLNQTGFPWDAIWIDGDHTDDYRWFHWNHTTYTDPVDMFYNISLTGRVAVTISDPHIAVDKTYDVYAGAKDGYFTKWANGSNYEADCWPGLSSWIDFLNPEAADYYSSWYSYEKFNGSSPTLAGIWNDMNEPAVFDESVEKTMPFEVLHAGNVTHGDIHNIYGLLHTKATHKALIDRDGRQKRPFVLTRSNFAGSQRYAAIWTGDNSATWEHFANSISQCMNANLMGMVFCGADIGGFIGNPSHELLQRWYQGAVWTPFFRGHSSRESDRREPYLFTNVVQEVLKKAMFLRYAHVPLLYTLFFEHTQSGDPIIAPLLYHYHYYPKEDRDTQIFVGNSVMAVAVTQPGVDTVEVLFPGLAPDDFWYRIDDGSFQVSNGGSIENVPVNITSSPVYYRGGSIVFTKNTQRTSVVEATRDPHTVYVNGNQENNAFGTLYVDDYYSFDYEDKNRYSYIAVSWNTEEEQLRIEPISGDSTGINITFDQIILHSRYATDDGSAVHEKIYNQTSDGIPLTEIKIEFDGRARNFEPIVLNLKQN